MRPDELTHLPPPVRRPSPSHRLVVAVGSNASTTVMARKLGAATPLFRVTVAGLTVGHSAHVSARGYVPAAPVVDARRQLTTAAVWLDPHQLTLLDTTEPNYDRMTVSTQDLPLDQPPVTDYSVYVSRHGVLGDDETGEPLAFGGQQTVFDWLQARLDDERLTGPSGEVCTRLADPSLGRAITELIADRGLARSADSATGLLCGGVR